MKNPERLLAEAGGIIIVSIIAGFIFNIFSPNRISVIYSANNNPFFRPERSSYSEEFPRIVGLKEAKAHFEAGSALFIDARPVQHYINGHIRGAISLPLDNFENRFTEIQHRLPKNHDIIVYCDNIHCDLSARLVYRLLDEGYLYCFIFENGIKHWQTVGYPVEEGAGDYAR